LAGSRELFLLHCVLSKGIKVPYTVHFTRAESALLITSKFSLEVVTTDMSLEASVVKLVYPSSSLCCFVVSARRCYELLCYMCFSVHVVCYCFASHAILLLSDLLILLIKL